MQMAYRSFSKATWDDGTLLLHLQPLHCLPPLGCSSPGLLSYCCSLVNCIPNTHHLPLPDFDVENAEIRPRLYPSRNGSQWDT